MPLELRRGGAATIAIAATWLHFLLFAQFAFVDLLRLRLPSANAVRPAMGAMGIAGLVGSLIAARLLRRWRGISPVRWGLAVCAVVDLGALPVVGGPALGAIAAAVGMSTAFLTVALASELRSFPGVDGRAIGWGTGIGYLLANVPAWFHGSPELRTVVAAAGCGLAALALAPSREGGPGRPFALLPAPGWRFAPWVGAFLLLIALDSAAFAIVHLRPELAAVSWAGGWRTAAQGGIHLLAAVVAGRLVDRGALGRLPIAAALVFAVALPALESLGVVAAGLYAVGISFYSVALVAAPSGLVSETIPARWRAALLFGVAGWIGSAAGVGMAEDLGRVPSWLPSLAAVLVLLAVGSATAVSAPGFRTLRPVLGVGIVALAAIAGLLVPPLPEASAGSPIVRGRAVYRAEGCIHCHSQYVRPGTFDESLWGPHRPLDRRERPPLIGTRRQGPDLSNVGIRRDAAWLRRQLLDPGSVVPGSRMPTYSELFAPGNSRGEDLLAYLASLGLSESPTAPEEAP